VSRHSFRDAVATYFKSRPNVWIPAVAFESIGGRQAWRTRLSECRRDLGMTIENRVCRGVIHGAQWTRSEYRYVPAAPITEESGHDMNGWGLRS
jgi:hypothetical protein